MLSHISKPAMFTISAGVLAAITFAGLSSRGCAPSLMAAGPADSLSSAYEAHLSGSVTGALRGPAEFGVVPGGTRFVTTLGAYSDEGAILLSQGDGRRPDPGIYRITANPAPEEIEVVIVTGSPTRPTGVFRAEHGVVAITTASRGRMTGEFELGARGFLAADPGREDRKITARGSFTFSRGGQSSSLSRWPWLLYPTPEEQASAD